MALTLCANKSSIGPGVQRLDPLQPGWDQLLLTHRHYSFFHGAAWARVLHETYSNLPFYFAILGNRPPAGISTPHPLLDDDTLVRSAQLAFGVSSPLRPPLAPGFSGRLLGLFPIMEANSLVFGRRAYSLPYTDVCEPLAEDSEVFSHLWQAALRHGRMRKWKYLVWRGCTGLFAEAVPSLSYYGHILDLSAGERELFAQFKNAVRRAIRKAERSGITVEISHSLEGIKTYYALHCLTRKKHGLPPQPRSFFENIAKHVLSQEQGCVVIGLCAGRPIAGVVLLRLGQKAIFKFGASDPAFQHLRANNLVMWEAIKWCQRQGLQELHFGRTSVTNDGLRRYKLGWGAQEYSIPYFKYDLRQDRLVSYGDQAKGWYNWIFNLMPAPLARLAGTVLYKAAAAA